MSAPTEPARAPSDPPAGVLVIDKPLGITSMGACSGVRRRLFAGGAPKRVKVGHGGTLDPLATGVLVVLVGRATRLSAAVMAGEKRYLADIDLAHVSTTDDGEGLVTASPTARVPTVEQVRDACARFQGTIMQSPPAHSAMWVGGKRAYALARAGRPPVLAPRPVVIHAIDVVEFRWPLLVIDVRCGKGTYIRSLARDLGRALGTGGMLAGLRRTAVGRFTIDQATPLDDLPGALAQHDLLPIEA